MPKVNNFNFDTPNNVEGMTEQEILNLAVDNPAKFTLSKSARLFMIKKFYEWLGLTLTNEALLILLSEPSAMLVEAVAGSGKTTISQVAACLQKLCRLDPEGRPTEGMRLLALVFNRHNVDDIKKKHAQMIKKINAGLLKLGPDFKRYANLDPTICSYTFHGFCNSLHKSYSFDMKTAGTKFLDAAEAETLVKKLMDLYTKQRQYDWKNVDAKKLLNFYSFTRESMLDDYANTPQFKELEIPLDYVTSFFEVYESTKIRYKYYDFSDMLWNIYNLLSTNDRIRHIIARSYDYIIADEVQDLSPLMQNILRLITDYGFTDLMCIGDSDQLIYGFRGANIDNLLHFSTFFDNGKVYSLSQNRRCATNICDAARYIIEENEFRFNKPIKSIKPGGKVRLIPYNTQESEHIQLINLLKELPPSELDDTLICYRDRNSSQILSYELFSNSLPVHILSGYGPFSHELFKHYEDCLNIINYPRVRSHYINLYKMTSLTSTECYETLGYDKYLKVCKKDTPLNDKGKAAAFYEINWEGRTTANQAFLQDLKYLSEASIVSELSYRNGNKDDTHKLKLFEVVPYKETPDISVPEEKVPLDIYLGVIEEHLYKYFWKFKRESINKNSQESDFYFGDVVHDLYAKRNISYDVIAQEIETLKQRAKYQQSHEMGVGLSTFHALKGLEARHVFIIDMADDIFPNFSLIDSRGFDTETRQRLKEEETRNAYMVMTRAKESLTIFYDENNPSYYVRRLLEHEELNKSTKVSNVEKPVQEFDVMTSFEPAVKEDSINPSILDTLESTSQLEVVEEVSPFVAPNITRAEDILNQETLDFIPTEPSQKNNIPKVDSSDEFVPGDNSSYLDSALAGFFGG